MIVLSKMTSNMGRMYVTLIPTLLIFFIFLYLIGFIETNTLDNHYLNMQIQGCGNLELLEKNIDLENVYSACFIMPESENKGAWTMKITVFGMEKDFLTQNQKELVIDYRSILYEGGSHSKTFIRTKSENKINIFTFVNGKKADLNNFLVYENDKIEIFLENIEIDEEIKEIEIEIDSGTKIWIDNPIYPIIGKRGVFIFFSFISGIFVTLIQKNLNITTKIKKGEENAITKK